MWKKPVLILVLLLIAAYVLGPRAELRGDFGFDPAMIGDDPDAYLSLSEAQFDDIQPGAEKRIIWAGEPGEATPFSMIYLHGFSATSEESRPLPDLVAETLGANLYFMRLPGHGRSAAAMAGPDADDWMRDVAEAVVIGERLGERVVLIGASTGGTLAALAAFESTLNARLAGVVLISPNFGPRQNGAGLLTIPFARWIVPLVLGKERCWQPSSEAHAKWWRYCYPSQAVLPVGAVVKEAADLPFEDAGVSALFIYAPDDPVIDTGLTTSVAGRWPGAEVIHPIFGAGDTGERHNIVGDILQPEQNQPISEAIVRWIEAL